MKGYGARRNGRRLHPGRAAGSFAGEVMITKLYRDYNSYLRETFGCRVQKISLDAGLSCPNRDGAVGKGGCIYCNERGSGTGAALRSISIAQQIAEGKTRLARRYKARKFLAYFQSFSNTYAPVEQLRKLYLESVRDPDVVGLCIGTRPDCVPDNVLDCIAEVGAGRHVWMEYGLQSAVNATLLRINRGHLVSDFDDALLRTRARGISVCAHVIIGLPGEGREEVLRTARFLSERDIQGVKIHLLYVVRGTVLHEWHQAGTYECISREEYAALVGEFLSLLNPEMVIQRLTGDPHPSELIVPLWALEKQQNIEMIREAMISRGLFQGCRFGRWSPD